MYIQVLYGMAWEVHSGQESASVHGFLWRFRFSSVVGSCNSIPSSLLQIPDFGPLSCAGGSNREWEIEIEE